MLEAGDDYLATVVDLFEQRSSEHRKAEARAKRKAGRKGK